MAELLIKSGAAVNARRNGEITPLHLASHHRTGSVEIAVLLLKHGAEISSRDFDDETPLHEAIINERTDTSELLIKCGADVDARARLGGTPLFVAASHNCNATFNLLIEYGAEMFANAHLDDELHDSTPLSAACGMDGCEGIMHLLLNSCAAGILLI